MGNGYKMFSQFLIYINLPVLICLDSKHTKGDNVCPKFFNLSINSAKVKDFRSQCCPDFYKKNNTCQVCPAGTYGNKCKEKCQSNYYGIQCKEMCNCLYGYMCNSVQGCIRKNTRNTTDPGGVSEPQKNILYDDIGTMTAASVSNPPEGCSIRLHIHIVIISVLAVILLVWLAAASVKIICDSRGQCGRISEMYNRQNDRRDLDQQQHNTAMTDNPYCETWEATSSVRIV